jgi:hypothetical protein
MDIIIALVDIEIDGNRFGSSFEQEELVLGIFDGVGLQKL